MLRTDQTSEQHDDDIAQKKTTSRSHIIISTIATQTVAEEFSRDADPFRDLTTNANAMLEPKIQ